MSYSEGDSVIFGKPADVLLNVLDDLAVGTSDNIEERMDAAFDGETSLKFHRCGTLDL